MHHFLILIFLTTAAGCATVPQRPTPVQLTIDVAVDANPDDRARPSPVVLSILDLAQPARFSRCSYLTLLSAPRKCLHTDMLATHRTQAVAPGAQRTIKLVAESGSTHIGIVAELVQFADAENRIDVPLHVGKLNIVSVRIDSHGIALRDGTGLRVTTSNRFNDD